MATMTDQNQQEDRMEKGDIVTVSATVKGYSTKDDIEKVHLEIPSWNSKYPTDVKVSAEQKMAMPKGMAFTLELVRENFQGNGQYQDREYGWYYGLLNIGDATTEPAPEAKAQNAAPALTERHLPRYSDVYAFEQTPEVQASINWQSARRDAVALVVARGEVTESWDLFLDLVIYTAERILDKPLPPLVQQAQAAGGVIVPTGEDTEAGYIPPGPDGEGE
jgi:hypothetical protein